jgi:hypothetical protein
MEPTWIVLCGIVLCVLGWFLWVSRGTGDADPNTLSYRFNRAWRRIAFWAGDVRFAWQWYFGFLPVPHFSWTDHEYAVSYETLLEACEEFASGDVLLATKKGYPLSNSAIPGLFKHAAIITDGPACLGVDDVSTFRDGVDTRVFVHIKRLCDIGRVRLVEAISEGVVERHPLWARADKMIVLRPKHMEERERNRAAAMAKKLVGCKYDASFKFNIEEELAHINGPGVSDEEIQDGAQELRRLQCNHTSEYDIAFSCTETVAAAWWFRRRQLGILRKKVRGRLCIVADQFVNRDFKVVWTNVTVEQARQGGLGEEGVREIEEWHKAQAAKRKSEVRRSGGT